LYSRSRPSGRVLLFERDVEQLFPILDELGVGFVAYSALSRGFISGTAKPAGECDVTDMRNVDRWQPGNFSARTSLRPLIGMKPGESPAEG
jgi:aryl-alcohol dehydrogenase-like predicted oxidoreductase